MSPAQVSAKDMGGGLHHDLLAYTAKPDNDIQAVHCFLVFYFAVIS